MARLLSGAVGGMGAIGSQTWNVVRPGPESNVDGAVVALARRCGARCRGRGPCPAPSVLGGEERLEDAAAGLVRDAGAVVGDVDAHARRRRGGCAIVIVPRLAERVDRVVDEVGPHLVELGAVDGQLREAGGVVRG